MQKRGMYAFLLGAALAVALVAGCTPEEDVVYCLFNSDCLPSEYCLNDGTLLDENGSTIGACVAAEACYGDTCPVGFDCVDGYCKPSVNPPQDYDTFRDDYTPPMDDYVSPVDDYSPPMDDYAPPVDDGFYPIDDDMPMADDSAPTFDDFIPNDDDTPVADSEGEPPDDEDTVVPDADSDATPTTFTATFTNPGDGARTKVARPDLVITFSLPVDETTLATGGGCSDPEYVITITPTVTINTSTSGLSSDKKTLILKLSQDLANDTTYTITVPNTIKSTGGVSLSQTYNWTFVADRTKPVAQLTVPSPTTNVDTATAIEITFSEAMDPATVVFGGSLTIVGSGSVPAVTGTPVWSSGDAKWTLQPDSPLETDTTYTVTLTASVTDVAGNTMDQAMFTFSTTDTVAPTVITTDPADGTDPAPVTLSAVTVTFSEKVTQVSETTFTVEKSSDGTPVIGTVSLSTDGLTASFKPAAPFEDNTAYTVTLNPDGVSPVLADLAGNPLVGNNGSAYVFSFTTGSSVCNDGYKTGSEACDDGNNDDGDYCACDCSAATQPINKVLVTYLGDINANGWYPDTTVCPGYTDVSGKKCSPSNYTEATFEYNINARKAYVFFDSDSSVVKSGFELIRNGTPIIKYPASGTYPNNAEMLWILDANNPIGAVTLRILADGIEYASSCNADFVRISACPTFTHGSVPATCNLEARYQGTTLPPTVSYPTNHLMTRFLSDEATVYDGFKLTANGVPYQTTPFNNYANNMDQYLDIVTDKPPTTVIFQAFETEMGGYGSSDYPGDYLYIYSCPPVQ